MSQPDRVAQLLEAAVPPIPPALRTPPYARIRRRALRRRLAVAGSSVAVAVLVATVGAVAYRIHPFREPSTMVNVPAVSSLEPTPQRVTLPDPHTPPPPLPGAPADAVSWRLVRVDLSGSRLTVYVNPPFQPCRYYPTATPAIEEGPDYVTVTLTAEPAPIDCSRVTATPIQVKLNHPLADRKVRNGRDGSIAVVVRGLPTVPSPWYEIPFESTYVDTGVSITYTRSGGPDLDFTVRPAANTAAQLPGLTDTPVRLGSRTGVLIGPLAGVQWQVGDQVYTMLVIPGEGQTGSMDRLQAVIDQLTWP